MPKMYQASADGIHFVHQIGVKLRNVVPEYQKVVLGRLIVRGDEISDAIPQAKEAREWIKTFIDIHARFGGRRQDGKKLKNGPDRRWTEEEIGDVGALAQWLINLDAARNTMQTGVRTPANQLTIIVDNLIVRERIVG